MTIVSSVLSSLAAGLIFGIGLLLSGMTNPAKVQNFLDITGIWDPSLGFVMAGAIAVAMPGYLLLRKKSKPVFTPKFQWPGNVTVDIKLITGAALFGIGWGIGGFCPGPAITSVPLILDGVTGALWFAPAMLAGLFAAKMIK